MLLYILQSAIQNTRHRQVDEVKSTVSTVYTAEIICENITCLSISLNPLSTKQCFTWNSAGGNKCRAGILFCIDLMYRKIAQYITDYRIFTKILAQIYDIFFFIHIHT